jgi:prevent-host-death family protein
MIVKVDMKHLQERLSDVLDQAADSENPLLIQRQGKNDVVIVSARHWRRLAAGKRVDDLGPSFRFPAAKQRRAEHLLGLKKLGQLTAAQRRELQRLLKESDDIMLRRAEALHRLAANTRDASP